MQNGFHEVVKARKTSSFTFLKLLEARHFQKFLRYKIKINGFTVFLPMLYDLPHEILKKSKNRPMVPPLKKYKEIPEKLKLLISSQYICHGRRSIFPYSNMPTSNLHLKRRRLATLRVAFGFAFLGFLVKILKHNGVGKIHRPTID